MYEQKWTTEINTITTALLVQNINFHKKKPEHDVYFNL